MSFLKSFLYKISFARQNGKNRTKQAFKIQFVKLRIKKYLRLNIRNRNMSTKLKESE